MFSKLMYMTMYDHVMYMTMKSFFEENIFLDSIKFNWNMSIQDWLEDICRPDSPFLRTQLRFKHEK